MSETTPSRSEGHLDELGRQVAILRDELDALRVELAHELRTQRVTVVDDDGFERITLRSHGHHGQVGVHGRGDPGRSTTVELFANDPTDGDGAHVGLALSDGGDVLAVFDVLHGSEARVRIEPVDQGT
jgi:hypothetical protein